MLRSRMAVVFVALIAVLAVSAFLVGSAAADPPKPGRPVLDQFISRLAKNLGRSEADVRAAIAQTEKELVDEAVQQGRLNQQQAGRAKERIDQGNLFGFAHPGPRGGKGAPGPRGPAVALAGGLLKTTADFLGKLPRDVLAELRAGKSLAEVAQAHGKTREGLKQALGDKTKQALSQAVSSGRLTQEQADKRLQQFQSRLDQLLDRKMPGPKGKVKPARQ